MYTRSMYHGRYRAVCGDVYMCSIYHGNYNALYICMYTYLHGYIYTWDKCMRVCMYAMHQGHHECVRCMYVYM
jgi:hypothetical protein